MFKHNKREGYSGFFSLSGRYLYLLWGCSIAGGCCALWLVLSPCRTCREYRLRLWRKQVGTDFTGTKNLRLLSANKPRHQYRPTFAEWVER